MKRPGFLQHMKLPLPPPPLHPGVKNRREREISLSLRCMGIRIPAGLPASAVSVTMGLQLPGEGNDRVVRRMMLFDTGPCSVNVRILNQQRDAAAQFALDRPRCGGDPVFDVVSVQEIVQCHPLLIIGKEDVPAHRVSH